MTENQRKHDIHKWTYENGKIYDIFREETNVKWTDLCNIECASSKMNNI